MSPTSCNLYNFCPVLRSAIFKLENIVEQHFRQVRISLKDELHQAARILTISNTRPRFVNETPRIRPVLLQFIDSFRGILLSVAL